MAHRENGESGTAHEWSLTLAAFAPSGHTCRRACARTATGLNINVFLNDLEAGDFSGVGKEFVPAAPQGKSITMH